MNLPRSKERKEVLCSLPVSVAHPYVTMLFSYNERRTAHDTIILLLLCMQISMANLACFSGSVVAFSCVHACEGVGAFACMRE